MSSRHRLVALMPMRHSSERVPGKNYRPFGDGRPLFHHMVDVMLSCPQIDKIVIDTDSELIKEQCTEQFPDVVVLDRPQHLLGGMTPMNDVLLHDISEVPSEFYLQTHSTNPLLTKETMQKAVDAFFENYPIYDSLFSVTRLQTRLWDSLARAVNHNPNILLRTQDLPPIYEENSCIFIFPGDLMKERHSRIGNRPFMFEMDRLEAQDIDEEIDFRVADLIFKQTRGV
ncbi:MAG: acylneuraminate cytidylyltransferase family protein [Methyloceanibacter sp.]|uniref:acylneuraminate cytidylyltransferase family protein n=1 Tax=Methyloceanibacter sp. TaxID=1965321 RepID=UPI001E11C6DC|nr:acylneuraminate cytidylyltransferase family protein [Methyloceanibacter sp.]MCB1442473.1 acylneuraminate cytidylyltransferase family protein [Methyloceanibacter sp.]MCC0059234.1 acylneuraminate cytidylyltransferase family protein [Hyphomicrobiaceae bacterium]